MGGRRLEIVLISANQLPRQNGKHSTMAVQAKAYISSKPNEAHETSPDRNGDVTATWDHTCQFDLKYSASFGGCQDSLRVELLNLTPGNLPAKIGEVEIPLSDWIALAGKQAAGDNKVYRLSPGGNIHLSYRLGPYHSKVGSFFRGLRSAVPTLALSYAVGHDYDADHGHDAGADGSD